MLKYSILIEYDDNDDIFVASVAELRGCVAHGSTPEAALREIKIAMSLWIEDALDNGEQIPSPISMSISKKVR